MAQPTTFPQFPKLLIELRHAIWELTYKGRRITVKTTGGNIWNNGYAPMTLTAQHHNPIVFKVCQESRDVATTDYIKLVHSSSSTQHSGTIYFNTKIDTLIFSGNHLRIRPGFVVRVTSDRLRDALSKVENLEFHDIHWGNRVPVRLFGSVQSTNHGGYEYEGSKALSTKRLTLRPSNIMQGLGKQKLKDLFEKKKSEDKKDIPVLELLD